MAKITLTGEFTAVGEESGVVQNTSQVEPVEIATTQEKGSGIILQPGERLQFASADSLYARSASGGSNMGGYPCTISVEPILQSAMDVNMDEITADVGDIKTYVGNINTLTTSIQVDVATIKGNLLFQLDGDNNIQPGNGGGE